MNIYGHDLNLTEHDPTEVVTDVMVIARTVFYDEDGNGNDAILTTTTRHTTGMIQTGMLHFALTVQDDDQ